MAVVTACAGRETIKGRDLDPTVIEDVLARFRGIAPVHGDLEITPTEMKPEELALYGIPPRPKPKRQPSLDRAWLRAFGRKLTIQPFQVEVELLQAIDFQPNPPEATLASPSRFGSSRNWSGASIAADGDQKFVVVFGGWTVPDITSAPAVANGKPYQCSAWIGLDGERRYVNSSLPQIGTMTEVKAPYTGLPAVQAWTQWYSRYRAGNIAVPLAGFSVKPGDEVVCSVMVLDPTHVAMVMVNLSQPIQPVGMPVFAEAPLITWPDGVQERTQISGATAEWVLERPGIPGTRELANFPVYTPTPFHSCAAGMSKSTGLAGLLTATERDLVAARYFRMYERLHAPERTRYISMPTRDGDAAMHLTYGDTAFA